MYPLSNGDALDFGIIFICKQNTFKIFCMAFEFSKLIIYSNEDFVLALAIPGFNKYLEIGFPLLKKDIDL